MNQSEVSALPVGCEGYIQKRGGSTISQGEGCQLQRGYQPIGLQNVCRKFHEYEKVETGRGNTSLVPPLNPPLKSYFNPMEIL